MTTEILDRIPPCDLECENGLLSACIVQPSNLDTVACLVDPADFWDDSNRILYAELQKMQLAGKPLSDNAVLAAELQASGCWEQIGGLTTIAILMRQGVAHRAHAVYYAKRIKKLAKLRNLITIGCDLVRDAYEPDAEPEHIASQAHNRLLSGGESEDQVTRLDEISREVLAELETQQPREQAVFTGLLTYDREEGPWLPGELIILAAKTSIGKTALALQISQYHGERQRPVLFVSLEMRRLELAKRIMAAQAGVPLAKVRAGEVDAADLSKLTQAGAGLQGSTVYVWVPTQKKDYPRIAAQAHRVKAEFGLRLLVIDYLQLMHAEDKRQPREQQVASQAHALKNLAVDLEVPVLCLCQLNRQADAAGTPALHHLRESGSLEQDADTVLFIHRVERKDTEGELIVAKHRNGRVGRLPITWDPNRQTFEDGGHDDERLD